MSVELVMALGLNVVVLVGCWAALNAARRAVLASRQRCPWCRRSPVRPRLVDWQKEGWLS